MNPVRRVLDITRPRAAVNVYLDDHDGAVAFDLEGGLRPTSRTREECDVFLSSSSLRTCFRSPWGGETLLINGCFRVNDPRGREPSWNNLFALAKYFELVRRTDLGRPLTWLGTLQGAVQRRD